MPVPAICLPTLQRESMNRHQKRIDLRSSVSFDSRARYPPVLEVSREEVEILLVVDGVVSGGGRLVPAIQGLHHAAVGVEVARKHIS